MIDLCLTNTLSTVVDSGVIHLSISDHSMVYIVRKAHYVQTGIRVVESRSMKKFNRDSFINDLRQQPWGNVYRHGNPNEMWGTWKSLLMNVIDRHAPLRTRRVSSKRSPWVTNELKHLMFNRDYLKKRAISSKDEKWCEYRRARNQVNNEIKKAKRFYFTKNLDIHKGDMKRSWKLINELNSRNCKKAKKISEIKMGEQVVTSSGEMAEIFNSYFSDIAADLAAEIPASEHKPETYLVPTNKTFTLEIPIIDTVYRLLKTIDEKKSSGLDKIPNKLLKIAADVIAPSLTEIFAKSIYTGIFPNEWKKARVSPVHKNGAKHEPSNYRPMSVIPTVSKIFEKIVFDQLNKYFNDNNLLTSCQSGFRSLHSTMTALLEATNIWSVNIDNGLVNGVVFIDLKKAFDTIDDQIILQKLRNYGIDHCSLKWFKLYLTGRTQKCKVNDRLSKSTSINCGIPQGSNLGPLLFLIYINDLPNCLHHATPRMFADDTSLSYAADSPSELESVINSELESLKTWLITNKLSLNLAKTEFMTIGSSQRITVTHDNMAIKLDGSEINKVETVKSLGVHIDKHLSWSVHVEKITKKIASAIGALKRIRPFITTKTAVQVYQALIQPHFDYCCSVWDNFGETLSNKLQKLQNRAVRVITRSPYDASASPLLDSLHLDNLSLRRKKIKAKMMFKVLKGDAPDYLQNLFSARGTGYNLRNSEIKLNLPKTTNKLFKTEPWL